MTNATTHNLPLPEYKTAAAKKPKWVFSHYGYFKNLWDVVILLATIYVAIIVPYNAAFHGAGYDQGTNDTFYCLGGDIYISNSISTIFIAVLIFPNSFPSSTKCSFDLFTIWYLLQGV